MNSKLKDFNQRVTRLSDWQLRIRARYEPMNGFSETAGLLHELLAYINSLEHQLRATPKTKPLSDEEICKLFNEHTGLGVHQKEADKADLLVFARAIEERHGIK